jgi:hypothetical protein
MFVHMFGYYSDALSEKKISLHVCMYVYSVKWKQFETIMHD